MARRSGAETPVRSRRSSLWHHKNSLAIIGSSLLLISLLSCARGGGTPPETLQPDSGTTTVADASKPADPEPYCGDGEIDSGEQCDTDNFGDATCGSLLLGFTGKLQCTQDCRIDDSMCYIPQEDSGTVGEEAGIAGYGG